MEEEIKKVPAYVDYYFSERDKPVKHQVDHTRVMRKKNAQLLFFTLINPLIAYIFFYRSFVNFIVCIFLLSLLSLLWVHTEEWYFLWRRGKVKGLLGGIKK